jgi:hypothetical protein
MAKPKKPEDQLRAAYQARQNPAIGGGVVTQATSIEKEAEEGLEEQKGPKTKGFLGKTTGAKGKGQISDVKKNLSTRDPKEYGEDRAEQSKTFQSAQIKEKKKGVKGFAGGAASQRFPKGVPPGAEKMEPSWDFDQKDNKYLTGQAKESRRQELWSNYRNAQVKLKKGARGSRMMAAIEKRRQYTPAAER